MSFEDRIVDLRKEAHEAGFTLREYAQIRHARSIMFSMQLGSEYGHLALAPLLASMTEDQQRQLREIST